MSFASITRRVRGEGGFSMAEVVVAAMLFTTAVVGLSSMLLSAGSLVGRGAKSNMAARLASQKIEEVKSLPFYTPSSSADKIDIDDYYYDTSKTNPEQYDTPIRALNTEAPVDTHVGYDRTTAVRYVEIGVGELVAADMAADWVPTNPGAGEIDKPTNAAGDDLEALVIEVRVEYFDEGVKRHVVMHALASKYISPGGGLDTVMLVESLRVTEPEIREAPPWANMGSEHNVKVEITIDAPDMTTDPGNAYENVQVVLWKAGTDDLEAIAGSVSVVSPTKITCRFDFGLTPLPNTGWYNLSVFWGRKGFTENNMRDCFEVRSLPAEIHEVRDIENVAGVAWGYGRQNARMLRVYGANFTGLPNSVLFAYLGTDAEPERILGNITTVNGDCDYMEVDFNLLGETGPNQDWNVRVENSQGSVDLADCFNLNPPPNLTSIQATSPGSYYDWTYLAQASRNIRINGSYLYGLSYAADSQCYLYYSVLGNKTADATVVGADPYGNSCTRSPSITMRFQPNTSSAGSGTWNRSWDVFVENYGGNDTLTGVLMNPVPVITAMQDMEGSSGYGGAAAYLFRKKSYTNITLSGRYFQTEPANPQVAIWKDMGGANDELVYGSIASVNEGSGNNMTIEMNLSLQLGSGTIAYRDGEDERGNYYMLALNDDGQLCDTPYVNCSVQWAPISYSSGPWSGYYNDWDLALNQIDGQYFDSANTTVDFRTSGGALYNPDSWFTIEGSPTVNGAYDTGQSISSGLLVNLINVPAATYRVRITDTEPTAVAANQPYYQKNYSVSTTTPQLISYSRTTGTAGSSYSGVRLYTRRTHGAGLNVRLTGPGYRKVCDSTWCCDCDDHTEGNRWYADSSAESLVLNRSGHQVYVNHTIVMPARSGWWSHTHNCWWCFSCSHSGYSNDPTTRSDDVDEWRLSGTSFGDATGNWSLDITP